MNESIIRVVTHNFGSGRGFSSMDAVQHLKEKERRK